MIEHFHDVARDLASVGICNWGVFSRETGQWLFATGTVSGDDPDGLSEFDPEALVVIIGLRRRRISPGISPEALPAVVLDILVDHAMDELNAPFPDVQFNGAQVVLEPPRSTVDWAWTSRGVAVCAVGSLDRLDTQ